MTKTIIVYTRVVKPAREQGAAAESYSPGAERFLRTYQEFKPPQPHELVILDCGAPGPEVLNCEDPKIPFRQLQYYGHGWDTGAYQFAANALDCDLMICCNSWSYFWRDDWLYPLVAARSHFGPGLYGVTASYERGPHLRTPCLGIDPQILREYPIAVNDRQTCCEFEAGANSITEFARKKQLPTYLMLADEALAPGEWRDSRLENIFRRGDQSNVLVLDRHTEIYQQASPPDRLTLESAADGPKHR